MGKHSSVKIGSIRTQLENVVLPIGLVLSSVDVEGEHVKITSHPFEVSLQHKANFHAHLKVSDLAAFLNEKAPEGLKNFKVTCEDGKILVEASKKILVDLPVKAVCKLKIQDRTLVYVDVISIEIMGSGATNFLQSLVDKINPVLDANDFPVDATFEHISIEADGVIVKGKMAPRG